MDQNQVIAGNYPPAVDTDHGTDTGFKRREQKPVVFGGLFTGMIPHDAAKFPSMKGPAQHLVHADASGTHGTDG